MRPEIVSAARGWIGTPYRHQASVRGAGCDCLGLLRGVWREVIGPEPEPIPPYTPDWSEAGREERLWEAARRLLHTRDLDGPTEAGEILLFRMRAGGVAKHLGFAARTEAGRQSFIHAFSGHGVVESALTRPWARRVVARFEFPQGAG